MRPEEINATGPLGSLSVRNLLARVGQIDAIEDARMAAGGGRMRSVMPGIKSGSATGMARRIIQAARAFGTVEDLHVAYGLRDNAVLQLHFGSQIKGISESIDVPLQAGFKIRGGIKDKLNRHTAEVFGQQAAYVARGFVTPTGPEGAYEFMSAGERVTRYMERMLEPSGELGGPIGLGARLRRLAPGVRNIYEQAVYTGPGEPLSRLAPVISPANILHATQFRAMATTGEFSDPLAAGLVPEEKFAFSMKGGLERDKATARMLAMRKALAEGGALGGLGLSDLTLKPEAGMASFVSKMAHGMLVPFGKYADPTRQTYQRWALLPFTGKTRPTPLTTDMFEAAAQIASAPLGPSQLQPRTTASYRYPTKIFMTRDPAVERAIAGKAGGMILSSEAALAMEYFTPEGEKRVPGVSTALISGMGGKYTVSAKATFFDKEIGGVTSFANYLKQVEDKKTGRMIWGAGSAKHPEAVRKLIIEDIMSQITGPGGRIEGPGTASKLAFLEELGSRIGGQVSKKPGHPGFYPVMSLDPGAKLNQGQMDRIYDLIKDYNRQSGAHLQTVLQERELGIRGIGGEYKRSIVGVALPDWLGVRTDQELDVVNRVVGRGEQVPGLGGIGMSYTPVAGKGMKVRLKEISNISIYGTPESQALAELYTQAVAGHAVEAKQDLLKIPIPAMGKHTLPGGIKLESLAAAATPNFLGPRAEGRAWYTAEEIAGTIFDPKHPFHRGLTIDLPGYIEVPGMQAGVGVSQLHVPGPASMGFRESPVLWEGKATKGFWVSESMHKAESIYKTAIQDPAMLRATYVDAIDQISRSTLGKKGFMRELIEPRMGQSGYFRATGMGTGALADVLGTRLPFPNVLGPELSRHLTASQMAGKITPEAATVLISEADVLGMGGEKLVGEFRAKGAAPPGYMFGLLQGYPAQSYAHSQSVLYKMTSAAEARALGPGGLGIHNALAMMMLRDFDADNLAAMIISGNQGQQILKNFSMRHSIPQIIEQAQALEGLIAAEKHVGPASLRYKEMLNYASDAMTASAHAAESTTAARVEQYYGTKVMTPMLDWWRGRMSTFLAVTANDAEKKTSGAILSAILQEAIGKGKGMEDDVSSIIDFTSVALKEDAFNEASINSYKASVKNIYRKYADQALGVVGLTDTEIATASMAMMGAQKHWRELAEKGQHRPEHFQFFLSRRADKVGALGKETPFKDMQQMVSLYTEALGKGIMEEEEMLSHLTGHKALYESGGLISKPATGKVTHAGVDAADRLLQEAGKQGKGLPSPLLDRLIDWFKRPKTPFYQKAGVIGGSALLGTAVLKNMLFPGYMPAEDQGFAPIHTAVPIPMRVPGYEQPQMESIFSRADSYMPVDSTFSMPPDWVNMGSRTTLPAVQMGAGTMQPGRMPVLAGGLFREPAPAPTVLNQERYNQSAPGMSVPPTVRLREPMLPAPERRAWEIEADLPEGGFDRSILTQMADEVRIMTEAEETELGIRTALAENEYSQFS